MARIIIDPGHGGDADVGKSSAFGARGRAGTLEKHVTLEVARQVVERLGGDAALTRASDQNLSLRARAARAVGADVFVSIHANSGPAGRSGPETWVHPSAGPSSRALAGNIQRALADGAGRYGGERAPLSGDLAVLSPAVLGSRTAACLVELDYLSHGDGEARLRDPSQRAALGAAIAGAIRQHLGHRSVTARAMTAESFDVRYFVPLIPQPTGMACWAASAAMLVSWREQMSRVDAGDIARGAGHWAEYHTGLNPHDVPDLGRGWRLTAEAPQSYTVEGLRHLLETRGPLWIGEAVPSLHAIVIAGIYGDGTPDGTHVIIKDPWPPGTGAEYDWTFRRMMQAYEAAAQFPAVNIQVLHNGGRGPVLSAGQSLARGQGWFDDLVDGVTDAVDPIANIFHRVADTNKLVATQFHPPAHYYDKVRAYAAANPADGTFLLAGLNRDPRWWQGGWILDVQTGASAMTLDRDVFFRTSLSIGTFAHELVHVGQYALLGPTAFLVSYFGLSGATIAGRLIRGEPLAVMNSSPHEQQAYDIAGRFATWLAANP